MVRNEESIKVIRLKKIHHNLPEMMGFLANGVPFPGKRHRAGCVFLALIAFGTVDRVIYFEGVRRSFQGGVA